MTKTTNSYLKGKKNCVNDWNRFRTDPEKYPEFYEPCGCCKDCMQLKGGHYCK